MIIEWRGHSEFLLESAAGYRVLTDPFDAKTGYPMHDVRADAVVVSHGHGDHSFTAKVTGAPVILRDAGQTRLNDDVAVSSITCYHDDEKGAKRGMTLLSVIEMDGLRVAHLGDLGCPLTERELSFLGQPDILMIPVGGFFTIDAHEAAQTVKALRPGAVVPMHYKTRWNESWPISGPEAFLKEMGAEKIEPVPLLRVTKEDVECLPPVVMFQTPKD